jgi:hypothetical protein
VWSAVASLVLLTTGCAATVPVAPPAPSTAEPAVTLYAISDAELASLSDAQFGALSDQQIAALTQTQVASLSESRRAAMTPSQRVALLLAQFSALTIPQVKALPPALFAALTPEQLRTLMPVHAQALTAAQLAALSPEQAAAAAAAAAAPDDAEGPSKALPPTPAGLPAGKYVNSLDQLIFVVNERGQTFSTGQFGYVSNVNAPPVVVPRSPGLKFTPPPVFSAPQPGATAKPTNIVDCEVRYVAMQNAPVAPTAPGPTTAPTTGSQKSGTTATTTDTAKKTYCN